jgi:hypothetical protein
MDCDGEALTPWLYKRCGKNEEDHSVMRDDLAEVSQHSALCLRVR